MYYQITTHHADSGHHQQYVGRFSLVMVGDNLLLLANVKLCVFTFSWYSSRDHKWSDEQNRVMAFYNVFVGDELQFKINNGMPLVVSKWLITCDFWSLFNPSYNFIWSIDDRMITPARLPPNDPDNLSVNSCIHILANHQTIFII